MFPRYELKVLLDSKEVFIGYFMSINRAIKTVCCFNNRCVFQIYDCLSNRDYDSTVIRQLVKEFKNGEICL